MTSVRVLFVLQCLHPVLLCAVQSDLLTGMSFVLKFNRFVSPRTRSLYRSAGTTVASMVIANLNPTNPPAYRDYGSGILDV